MTTKQGMIIENLTEEVEAIEILEYLYRQQGYKPFIQFLRNNPCEEFLIPLVDELEDIYGQ